MTMDYIMQTKKATAAVVTVPVLAIGLLLGLWMLAFPFATHSVRAQSEGVRIGQLRLAANTAGRAADFVLELEQIAPPPPGEHYELWMVSDSEELLRLGAFEVGGSSVTFAASTGEDLLADYNSVLISLEPDDDADEATISQVALSSTLPSNLLTLTRQLLTGSEAGDPALLDSLQAQITIAAEQNSLLADALADDDFTQVRSRAEQIVNILDGESGLFFGDLDRNGEVDNAGDGVGVRGYLQLAHQSVLQIQNAVSNTAKLDEQATQLLTVLEEKLLLVEQMRDQAQKIFAADTKAESEAVSANIATLLNELATAMDDAQITALGLVLYPFYSTTAIPAHEHGSGFDGPLRLGELRLTLDSQGRAGGYALTLEQIEEAPNGEHYELWMQADDGAQIRLGEFDVDAGSVTYTGSIDEDLLGEYNSALISLVPDDAAEETIETIVLSSTLPSAFLTLSRQLLTRGEAGEAALFAELETQIAIAAEHSDFMVDALILDDMPEVRRHAEHVVNILDGETGDFFGDINRDGQAQNPGNGVGVRVYLEEAQTIALEVGATNPSTANFDEQSAQLVALLEENHPLVAQARDHALSIFGISDELELLEAARSLVQTMARLTAGEEQAHESAMGLVVYEFFEPLPAGDSAALDSGQPVTRTAPTPIVSVTPPLNARAGQSWTHPVEGAIYLHLPAGEATLGADTDDLLRATENSQHTVEVEAFWLRQSEVSNAHYQLCVDQGGCTPPNNPLWQEAALADHPVTHLSWEQAGAYARWAGGRLPTEAEWEYGCRGETDQEYAWGDAQPTADLANYLDDPGEPVAVGSYAEGATAFGLLDMGGNVWEWTSSLPQLYPYDAQDGREETGSPGLRIGRGGSFGFGEEYLRCSTRQAFHPDWQIPHLGLRVVIDDAE